MFICRKFSLPLGALLVALFAIACSDHADRADNSAALAADLSGALGTQPRLAAGPELELRIEGIGTNNARSEIVWVNDAPSPKSLATPSSIATNLDLKSLSTSSTDIGGFRFVTAIFQVRNAQACGTAGTCTPYASPLTNGAFIASARSTNLSGTAFSSLTRFDGTPADPAIATQLLPMHGVSVFGAVDPTATSLQIYRESELPAFVSPITTVFPYGFVFRNINDGSRTLPANPASNQYDGTVALAFRFPLQTNPADNPFKFAVRFISTQDPNTRVVQSLQEQNFAGDDTTNARARSLNSKDQIILGNTRLAQVYAGDPICSVRIAGLANAGTAFLVNNTPSPAQLIAAPMNLENVPPDADPALGFCDTMTPPTATTLFVHGSMSGFRKTSSAYGGAPDGGSASTRPNQLAWSLAGQRPFFAGETVTVTATSLNTNSSASAISRFVAQYRVRGSIAGSASTFRTHSAFASGMTRNIRMGDMNGDGRLDLVGVSATGVEVRMRTVAPAPGVVNAINFINSSQIVQIPVSGAIDVALGDVNNDGVPDIVTSNSTGTVSVILGTGTPTFGAPTSFATGGGVNGGLALGDLNGDGRTDIVITQVDTDKVSVLLGNGAGGFSSATNFSTAATPFQIALGDMNNDGVLDIVTTHASHDAALPHLAVLRGNGAGGFALPQTLILPLGAFTSSISLSDMNGDGRLDVVTAQENCVGFVPILTTDVFGGVYNPLYPLFPDPAPLLLPCQRVAIVLGQGDGSLSFSRYLTTPSGLVTLTTADVNGDGLPDVVTSSIVGPTVFTGTGAGGFVENPFAGLFQETFALGDLNADGRLDLVSDRGTILLGR